MGALRVVHQRHGRGRDAREVIDLAGVVHAHLDHRVAMVLAQLEQGERHADVVVEVALGGEHRRARAAMCGQDCREHLLHRRLAVAAGERHQRQREARPPVRGEPPERKARIRDHHLRKRGLARQLARHERGGGAAARRFGDEVVGVEALAPDRDEEIAYLDRAAVARHARETSRRPVHATAQRTRGVLEAHHESLRDVHAGVHAAPLPHSASAACATSRSLNGKRTPAISW